MAEYKIVDYRPLASPCAKCKMHPCPNSTKKRCTNLRKFQIALQGEVVTGGAIDHAGEINYPSSGTRRHYTCE